MSDVAAVAGVSAGRLFAAFRTHRGCSPVTFLRARRLELARTRLISSPRATVAEIALACGFAHLGRFSISYRERFGESPKQTLQRTRAARAR
jgi:transcriptional regulator GlxA family with amidase domain